MNSTLRAIQQKDPDFLYVILADPNEAGHCYGNALDNPENYSTSADPENMFDVIEEADKQVGRLIEFLQERGTFNDSIIVITDDHGMSTMYDQYRWDDEKCQ